MQQPDGYDQLFENLEANLSLLRDASGKAKAEHEVLYNLSNALCGLGTILREEFERLHKTLQRIEHPKSR